MYCHDNIAANMPVGKVELERNVYELTVVCVWSP